MPSKRNVKLLSQITNHLQSAQAVYLVDSQGLSANQLTELRAQIREAGGQLVIVKNTLFQRALHQIPADHPCSPKLQITNYQLQLSGSTAALFVPGEDLSAEASAKTEQISPLKVIVKFAKDHQLPTLKLGFINHQLLTANRVEQLATLPGQDQLRAQVTGMLQSPINRLVFGLQANIQKLTIMINQIKDQKSH